ncbi:hypothetical protein DFJ74DRAFT_652317 [Hyaloraphidium curvatum]|nr:hypothetical protein DFJ74DRAFT_652317 [Hyaloraphidium curvatum]
MPAGPAPPGGAHARQGPRARPRARPLPAPLPALLLLLAALCPIAAHGKVLEYLSPPAGCPLAPATDDALAADPRAPTLLRASLLWNNTLLSVTVPAVDGRSAQAMLGALRPNPPPRCQFAGMLRGSPQCSAQFILAGQFPALLECGFKPAGGGIYSGVVSAEWIDRVDMGGSTERRQLSTQWSVEVTAPPGFLPAAAAPPPAPQPVAPPQAPPQAAPVAIAAAAAPPEVTPSPAPPPYKVPISTIGIIAGVTVAVSAVVAVAAFFIARRHRRRMVDPYRSSKERLPEGEGFVWKQSAYVNLDATNQGGYGMVMQDMDAAEAPVGAQMQDARPPSYHPAADGKPAGSQTFGVPEAEKPPAPRPPSVSSTAALLPAGGGINASFASAASDASAPLPQAMPPAFLAAQAPTAGQRDSFASAASATSAASAASAGQASLMQPAAAMQPAPTTPEMQQLPPTSTPAPVPPRVPLPSKVTRRPPPGATNPPPALLAQWTATVSSIGSFARLSEKDGADPNASLLSFRPASPPAGAQLPHPQAQPHAGQADDAASIDDDSGSDSSSLAADDDASLVQAAYAAVPTSTPTALPGIPGPASQLDPPVVPDRSSQGSWGERLGALGAWAGEVAAGQGAMWEAVQDEEKEGEGK